MTNFRRRNPLGELLAGRVAVGRVAAGRLAAWRSQDSTDVKNDGTDVEARRAGSAENGPPNQARRRG